MDGDYILSMHEFSEVSDSYTDFINTIESIAVDELDYEIEENSDSDLADIVFYDVDDNEVARVTVDGVDLAEELIEDYLED